MDERPCLKICGITNADDARLVAASGADYCGILVDVPFSERSLSLLEAKDVASAADIPVVILLCDPDGAAAEGVVREIKPYALQLLCRESPAFVREMKSRLPCRIWKTVHLPPPAGQASPEAYAQVGADALIVDRADRSEGVLRLGGTGKTVDWNAALSIVEAVSIPVLLAGGITPENVEQALDAVRPAGIDVCSGVEASNGRKDPEKVRALVHHFNLAATRGRRGEK